MIFVVDFHGGGFALVSSPYWLRSGVLAATLLARTRLVVLPRRTFDAVFSWRCCTALLRALSAQGNVLAAISKARASGVVTWLLSPGRCLLALILRVYIVMACLLKWCGVPVGWCSVFIPWSLLHIVRRPCCWPVVEAWDAASGVWVSLVEQVSGVWLSGRLGLAGDPLQTFLLMRGSCAR